MQSSSAQAQSDVAWVVEVRGANEIKRRGRQQSVPLHVGATVERGDILVLADDTAEVTLFCADFQFRTVRGHSEASLPCDHSQLVQASDGLASPARDPDTLNPSTTPIVVSPRATIVRQARPPLRWLALRSAPRDATYTITIKRGNTPICEDHVRNATTIPYPAHCPELDHGEGYALFVTLEGEPLPSTTALQHGFELLDGPTADVVSDDLQIVTNAKLPHALGRLLRAHVLLQYGLRSEALEEVENTSAQSCADRALCLLLGDIAWDVGVLPLARIAYEHAHLLARGTGDIEGVMHSAARLGQIAFAEYRTDEARTYLEEARRMSTEIGDQVVRQEVEDVLGQLP